MANRVIVIDPWWNETAEEQAFARVHRIGQEKSTHMFKIFTRSEVDQVIENMQRDKSAKIAYALQDDGHTPVQLTDEQLGKIFSNPDEKKHKRSKSNTILPPRTSVAAGQRGGRKIGSRGGK